MRIDGAAAGDRVGGSVAAGDVDGDGRSDVLVGGPYGRMNSGSAYVVFGQRSATKIDLAALGARGFRIDGVVETGLPGLPVASAGDVNGDGRADVLLGASSADKNGRRNSGSAYVVFGKSDTTSVDLAALGARGFRIDGAAANDEAGDSVAGAGDVNGDGRADVLVGAPGASNNGRNSGSAYVVFGKTGTASVDLAALGARGFRMDGAAGRPRGLADSAGRSVAGIGDMNGDGRADVLVGAPDASNNGRELSGSAYVVFGQASATTIDLAALGARGFRIDGAADTESAGSAVACAGDVNGDGRADVLVGAGEADNNALNAGSAYVVFGKTDPTKVDLAALGAGGFRIDGTFEEDGAGDSVAGIGDMNGDGRADVLVGSGASHNRRMNSGSAYVVFGKTGRASVDLAALRARGFRIDGAAVYDNAGASVAGAVDVNGDGWVDVLVGAPGASNNGRKGSGSAYVVFGTTDPANVDLAAATDTAPPKLVLGGPRSQGVLDSRCLPS
jgi:FG-GAP repeat protein